MNRRVEIAIDPGSDGRRWKWGHWRNGGRVGREVERILLQLRVRKSCLLRCLHLVVILARAARVDFRLVECEGSRSKGLCGERVTDGRGHRVAVILEVVLLE